MKQGAVRAAPRLHNSPLFVVKNCAEFLVSPNPRPKAAQYFVQRRMVDQHTGRHAATSDRACKGSTRQQEVRAMKSRWMKTVIETSKEAQPALPFQRGQRKPRAGQAEAAESASRKVA
jgi:hypothetical protein